MKLSNIVPAIREVRSTYNLSQSEVYILLHLSDTIWDDAESISKYLNVSANVSYKWVNSLKDKNLISIGRIAHRGQGIPRKYSITQKGKEVIRIIMNQLND